MRRFFSMAMLLVFGSIAQAASPHGSHGGGTACPAPDPTALRCAGVATPVQTPDGALLLAWSAGGRVMAARTADRGRTFGPAVAVNPGPQSVDDNGEARPAVAADREGRVFVAWSVKQEKAFSGTLWFSRSLDGGRTFEPARTLASDPASQRFAALAAAPGGRLYLAWIDKRWLVAAKEKGEQYRGAALVLTWSDDGGTTFRREEVAASHHSCECCRLALALRPDGRPWVMWRHIFPPNVRDHVVVGLGADDRLTDPVRIAVDDWRVDACPHHGPSLAVSGDGRLHAAWYTQGSRGKGVFYAGGAPFGPPIPVGDRARAPSHPQVVAEKNRLWLAWREFDGERASVMAQGSTDGGSTWSEPQPVATTNDGSDRPLLLLVDGRAHLSWQTRAEGWRLVPLVPEGSK